MKLFKRILGTLTSAVCAVTICIPLLGSEASAATSGTAGYLTYTVYDNYVEITDCDSAAPNVNIPSEILNLPVTKIGESAFENCSVLSEVTIPDSVIVIESHAFFGCENLVSAAIPSSVTSIGDNAFTATALLEGQSGPVYYVSTWAVKSDNATSVEIKSGTVGIADNVFANCGLQTLSIPNTVKIIGNYAFFGNSDLRTVSVPSSVRTIGTGAFAECSSLLQLALSSGIESIGSKAFYNCNLLETIKIPDSVNKIGQDAFTYTKAYSSQIGPVIYIDTWVVNCLDSTTNLSITINSGTKGIADGTFEDKNFVTAVSIPSGVTIIGDKAFDNCSALSQITIPESTVKIGSYAFANTLIPNVVVPESVSVIGFGAFYGCSNLTDITIKNPKCSINDSQYTISSTAKMHVFDKSTAYDYAIKYNRTFDYLTIEKPPVFVLGDVNSDGQIDVFDAIAIAQYTVGRVKFTPAQEALADFNKSGKVDVFDAIAIAKYTVSPH